MTTLEASGPSHWTSLSKDQRATMMFCRALDFLYAAEALGDRGQRRYVFLHLLCQGTELLMKSALLFYDYEKYSPKLRRLSHRLVQISKALQRESGLRMPGRVFDELRNLDKHYGSNDFRYGTILDLFVDVSTLPYANVRSRSRACVWLMRRDLLKRGLLLLPPEASHSGE